MAGPDGRMGRGGGLQGTEKPGEVAGPMPAGR